MNTNNKRKLLIIYPGMFIGGSTTSLLSLLNELDYSKVDVDLLLADNHGELMSMIPNTVNIISCPTYYHNNKVLRIRKTLSPISCFQFIRAVSISNKKNSFFARQQITQKDNVRYYRSIEEEYDIAISYMELWSLYYLAEKTKAKKKIGWYHINTSAVGMNPQIEKSTLSKIDKIVFVANACKENFDDQLPEYKEKSIVIENLLSKNMVVKRSKENIDFALPIKDIFKYKMITVCRIDFKSKGLNRAISILSQLRKEGVLDKQIGWYIVGDGEDSKELHDMISKYHLDDMTFMCGKFNNPMPLVAQCDIFFLPSYYEGKPMAVTEAQMLGVVPFVTQYPSAPEQINNEYDGVIMQNSEEGIYKALKELCLNSYDLDRMKKNVQNMSFTNDNSMSIIENLIYK